MTSVKSSAETFSFTFKRTFKKAWMLPAALFALMTYLIPAGGGGILAVIRQYNYDKLERGFDKEAYFALRKFVYLDTASFDMRAFVVQGALIGLSVLLAVQIFRFVASKKMVNVYYSLGITRKNMFVSKYLCGVVMLTVAIFLPIAISAVANAAFFGVCREMVISHLYYFLNYEVLAMFCFGVTVATLSCVGSVAEGAIYSGILLLAPMAVIETLETMMSSFLYGAPFGKTYRVIGGVFVESSSIVAQKSWLNPLYVLLNGENMSCYKYVLEDITKPDSHEWAAPDFTYAAVWGAAAVLVFFIGQALFKKRKAEISGFLGANRLLTGISVFFAGVGVSAIFLNDNSDGVSPAPFLLFGCGAIFVFYTIASFVLFRSFKAYFKRIYMVLPHFAIYTAAALVFISGFFGFSSKMPDKSEIKSVGISTGTANTLVCPGDAYADNYSYYPENGQYDESDLMLIESGIKAKNAVNLKSYSGMVMTGLTEPDEIDFALKIHKELIDIKGLDFSKNNICAEPDKRPVGTQVWIVYELKNGKTFERRYTVVTKEILDELAAVQNSEVYRKALLDSFTIPQETQKDNSDSYDGIYTGVYYSEIGQRFATSGSIGLISKNLVTRTVCTQFDEDIEQREALLAAIREDISAGRAHSDLKSDKPAIGYISTYQLNWNTFDLSPENKKQMMENYGDNLTFSLNSNNGCTATLPVYEDMTSTVAYLTEAGLINLFNDTQAPVKVRICKIADMATSSAAKYYESYFDDTTSEISGCVYYQDIGNSFFPGNSLTYTDAETVAKIAANTRYAGYAEPGEAFVELIYADGVTVHGAISASDIPQ